MRRREEEIQCLFTWWGHGGSRSGAGVSTRGGHGSGTWICGRKTPLLHRWSRWHPWCQHRPDVNTQVSAWERWWTPLWRRWRRAARQEGRCPSRSSSPSTPSSLSKCEYHQIDRSLWLSACLWLLLPDLRLTWPDLWFNYSTCSMSTCRSPITSRCCSNIIRFACWISLFSPTYSK